MNYWYTISEVDGMHLTTIYVTNSISEPSINVKKDVFESEYAAKAWANIVIGGYKLKALEESFK